MRRPRAILGTAIVGGGLGWLVLTAGALSAPVRTDRIDVALDGGEPDARGMLPSLSATGRFVAFSSSATNLVAGDTNGTNDDGLGGRDVFVRDRRRHTTTRVSVATGGAQGDHASDTPSISADGRYVAFFSEASNLVRRDTNDWPDVFVHDRQRHRTVVVSVSSAGAPANRGALPYPSISADGRFVVFVSMSSNLGAISKSRRARVFIHDLRTGRTVTVGRGSGGPGSAPSVSAHGRFVVFQRLQGARSRVLLWDRETKRTARVDVDSRGRAANGGSGVAQISADGRYIAFESEATNLVPGDDNGGQDVFVRDVRRRTTTRASIDVDGSPFAECPVEDLDGLRQQLPCAASPVVSASGRYLGFTSPTPQSETGASTDSGGVFVRDLRRGRTRRVSAGADDGDREPIAISGDGRFVAYAGTGLYVRGPMH